MEDRGRQQEDGPETWETSDLPWKRPGDGDPDSKLRRAARQRGSREAGPPGAKNKSPHQGRHAKGRPEAGRKASPRGRGVGWPHKSEEGGEGEGTPTQRSKGEPECPRTSRRGT
jgi:hypothetical protein